MKKLINWQKTAPLEIPEIEEGLVEIKSIARENIVDKGSQ